MVPRVIATTEQSPTIVQHRVIAGKSISPQQNNSLVETDSSASLETDFLSFMKSALEKTGKTTVDEEELYAALLEQRLQAANPAAAKIYRESKNYYQRVLARDDGYVSLEQVGVHALQAVVRAGALSAAEAERINGQAFVAAQLDGNTAALYDGRGSPGDPTIAIAPLEQALFKSWDVIANVNASMLNVQPRLLDLMPSSVPGTGGSTSQNALEHSQSSSSKSSKERGDHGKERNEPSEDFTEDFLTDNATVFASPGVPLGFDMAGAPPAGASGFEWHANQDGKLTVYMPPSESGLDRVEIHNNVPASSDTKLGEGQYQGQTNAGQGIYGFDKPGKEYGNDVVVVGFEKDGDQVMHEVSDGSQDLVA